MADVSEGLFAPATYRDMCVPFKDGDEANAALKAFCNDLYELRIKHRIADLTFVVQVALMYGQDEGIATSVCHFGDSDKAEAMAGFAVGYLAAERQERVSNAITSGGKKGVKKLANRK